jgi:hypothetical protein
MTSLDFGPVYIRRGKHKGRIGNFDDITVVNKKNIEEAIVLFGHPLLTSTYAVIPIECLEMINTHHLLERMDYLSRVIYLKTENKKKISDAQKITYLEEINYINYLFGERMFDAMFNHDKNEVSVFLSHSSKDKNFVKSLAVDLKHYGISVWLDEWEINIGESIPTKVGEGIENCQYLALILSQNSVESKWVEIEWQAKYWDELESGKIHLLPILIEHCAIPKLLKHKKYADFTEDYSLALDELVNSISKLNNG